MTLPIDWDKVMDLDSRFAVAVRRIRSASSRVKIEALSLDEYAWCRDLCREGEITGTIEPVSDPQGFVERLEQIADKVMPTPHAPTGTASPRQPA